MSRFKSKSPSVPLLQRGKSNPDAGVACNLFRPRLEETKSHAASSLLSGKQRGCAGDVITLRAVPPFEKGGQGGFASGGQLPNDGAR